MKVGIFVSSSDITKTLGTLLDQRSSKLVENPGFTSLPKVSPDLNFLALRFPTEGLPREIFLPDSGTTTIRIFIGPPQFLSVTDRGPVDFPVSVSSIISCLDNSHPYENCQPWKKFAHLKHAPIYPGTWNKYLYMYFEIGIFVFNWPFKSHSSKVKLS